MLALVIYLKNYKSIFYWLYISPIKLTIHYKVLHFKQFNSLRTLRQQKKRQHKDIKRNIREYNIQDVRFVNIKKSILRYRYLAQIQEQYIAHAQLQPEHVKFIYIFF